MASPRYQDPFTLEEAMREILHLRKRSERLDAILAEQEKSAAPIAQEPVFCWLVELFQRRGNSMGRYHTGLTGLDNQSRYTADPCQAKRYTKEEAEYAADALNVHMKACEWRAVEHGFHVVSVAHQVAQEPVAPKLIITLRQAQELVEFFGGDDTEVCVVPNMDGTGLCAYVRDYPEEGSVDLGPTEVADEAAPTVAQDGEKK